MNDVKVGNYHQLSSHLPPFQTLKSSTVTVTPAAKKWVDDTDLGNKNPESKAVWRTMPSSLNSQLRKWIPESGLRASLIE